MAKIIAGRRYVVLSFLKAWSSFFLFVLCLQFVQKQFQGLINRWIIFS
jgi:hypothetical protein